VQVLGCSLSFGSSERVGGERREVGEREGKWGKVREREGKWRKGSNRIVERERERGYVCGSVSNR
jgi:hypothetical protein